MVSRDKFEKLIKELSQLVVDAPINFEPSQRNEEWTKYVFILPLLEGLGWDRCKDVGYEDKDKPDVEGSLDFIIICQPKIGIEAKKLDVQSPQDRSHPQIKKGLKQSKDRGAEYFIWTNGDCWQFFSLALPDAPMYVLRLSHAHGDPAQIQNIYNDFQIIEKDRFTADPKFFDEAIREKWKMAALPDAWDKLVNERKHDLLPLVRESLPSVLDIEDEEILSFFHTLTLPITSAVPAKKSTKRPSKEDHSFPEDWQKLLDSIEPEYERVRERLSEGYYLKLAQYLISDQYGGAWSSSITYIYVGAPNITNERKKLGSVISLFKKWSFIKEVEGTDKYQRVEESVHILRSFLNSQ